MPPGPRLSGFRGKGCDRRELFERRATMTDDPGRRSHPRTWTCSGPVLQRGHGTSTDIRGDVGSSATAMPTKHAKQEDVVTPSIPAARRRERERPEGRFGKAERPYFATGTQSTHVTGI